MLHVLTCFSRRRLVVKWTRGRCNQQPTFSPSSSKLAVAERWMEASRHQYHNRSAERVIACHRRHGWHVACANNVLFITAACFAADTTYTRLQLILYSLILFYHYSQKLEAWRDSNIINTVGQQCRHVFIDMYVVINNMDVMLQNLTCFSKWRLVLAWTPTSNEVGGCLLVIFVLLLSKLAVAKRWVESSRHNCHR